MIDSAKATAADANTAHAENALDRFFNPRSIAVIGASDDPSRIGGRTLQNILRGGFEGRVFPINPGRSTVQGLKSYPDIESVPESVDCAVIALPGELVVPVALACERKGIRALVIFSAGFNEAGEAGRERQDRLREIVDRSDMRIIGPNCLGAFNAANGTWLSFTTQFQERPSGPAIGIVSQSGGSAAHMLKLAQNRGLAIGKFVTTGNEADVEFADGLSALAHDPEIAVIVAYIEGVRSGPSLIAALEKARDAPKPVLVIKVGRTSAGAQAAASHTASMAGEDSLYDAIFREFGVYRARTMEDLLDVAGSILAAERFPQGNRLGIVTISGGIGAQIADAASDEGMILPTVPEDCQSRLRERCPPGIFLNPVDVTAQLSTDPGLLATSMRLMLETGEYDALLAFFGIYAGIPRLSDVFLQDLTRLRADHPDAIIALCMVAPPEETARYEKAGFLVFEEPARAIHAISALRRLGMKTSETAPSDAAASDGPAIPAGARFDESEAKALLASVGIDAPREKLIASPDEIESATSGMRFPLAIKIVSPDIAHKTEVGGVRLGCPDAAAAHDAARDILDNVRRAAPQARINGLLLSEMIGEGQELIIGTRRDPIFGQFVMVGFGGTTAELIHDVAVRRAPVDAAQANEMLRSLRTFPLLDGWRGTPRADVDAAVAAICAVSRIAAANADTLESIEINPLRLQKQGAGAYALDALIQTCPGDDA